MSACFFLFYIVAILLNRRNGMEYENFVEDKIIIKLCGVINKKSRHCIELVISLIRCE